MSFFTFLQQTRTSPSQVLNTTFSSFMDLNLLIWSARILLVFNSSSQCVPACVRKEKKNKKNNDTLKERQQIFTYVACDVVRQIKNKIPIKPFYLHRLSHAQRSAVKVLRRMQYFVARRKFQVSERQEKREDCGEKEKGCWKQGDVCVFVGWGLGWTDLSVRTGVKGVQSVHTDTQGHRKSAAPAPSSL